MNEPRIAFIGAGNMASAIIGGLIRQGVAAHRLRAADPSTDSRQRLETATGIATLADNTAAVADADIVVLAVKPQVMAAVLRPLTDTLQSRRPLLVSIAAGIPLDRLQAWSGGDLPWVRCMPNTPALVQAGMTALYADATVTDAQRTLAEQVLDAVGDTLWVDNEALLDAVTAVSGSGPAYFFLVMEAMQAAGETLGLPADTARRLTQQTALGAARLALDSDVPVAELRRRVTSPGGTTEQALAALEAGGLRDLFDRALRAAAQRSRELADHLDD